MYLPQELHEQLTHNMQTGVAGSLHLLLRFETSCQLASDPSRHWSGVHSQAPLTLNAQQSTLTHSGCHTLTKRIFQAFLLERREFFDHAWKRKTKSQYSRSQAWMQILVSRARLEIHFTANFYLIPRSLICEHFGSLLSTDTSVDLMPDHFQFRAVKMLCPANTRENGLSLKCGLSLKSPLLRRACKGNKFRFWANSSSESACR